MPDIIIRIIRRRRTEELKSPFGPKSLVYVTYSTNQLSPETISFIADSYTLESEQSEIIKRIKTRSLISDSEITFAFTER